MVFLPKTQHKVNYPNRTSFKPENTKIAFLAFFTSRWRWCLQNSVHVAISHFNGTLYNNSRQPFSNWFVEICSSWVALLNGWVLLELYHAILSWKKVRYPLNSKIRRIKFLERKEWFILVFSRQIDSKSFFTNFDAKYICGRKTTVPEDVSDHLHLA